MALCFFCTCAFYSCIIVFRKRMIILWTWREVERLTIYLYVHSLAQVKIHPFVWLHDYDQGATCWVTFLQTEEEILIKKLLSLFWEYLTPYATFSHQFLKSFFIYYLNIFRKHLECIAKVKPQFSNVHGWCQVILAISIYTGCQCIL